MSRDGIGMRGWCAAPVGAVILARQKTKLETKKSTRPIPGNNQFPPRRRSKMVRDVNGRWTLACIASSEPCTTDFFLDRLKGRTMSLLGPGTEPRVLLYGSPCPPDDTPRPPNNTPCPPDDTPRPPNNTPCPPDDTTPASNSDSSIAYGHYLPRVTLRMFFLILITIIVFLSPCYPPSGFLHQSIGALAEDNVRDFKRREQGRPSNPTIYHQTQQSTSSIIMVGGQEVVPAVWDTNASSDTFNEPELSDLSIPSPDPSISDNISGSELYIPYDEFMRRDFQRREEEFVRDSMRDWLKLIAELEQEREEETAQMRATLLEWGKESYRG